MRIANISVNDAVKIANRSSDLYHLVQQVKLFHQCSKESWESISQELIAHRFTSGSIIVRAGERRDSIFIIAEGMASRIMVDSADSLVKQRLIATEFFGSQALFGFMPHPATVTAEADILVYELNKNSLEKLFKIHPELMEAFALTLAELNLADERAVFHEDAFRQEELSRMQYIYIGQLEANYLNSSQVRNVFASNP
jgi:CRP-like cAMP-binding protein